MATIRYRSSFAKMGVEAREELVRRVAQLGKDAIDYAFEQGFRKYSRRITDERYRRWLERKGKSTTSSWDDISGNLRDSFGSAVYVNGELRTDTIKFANENPIGGRTRDAIDPRSGREALMDYFRSIHPGRGKNDIVLICVSAMYYTKFLEAGTHGGHYKIKVVSTAAEYVRKHWEAVVSGIYKSLRIKKPATKVIKGDIRPLKDSGYYG